MQGYIIIAFRLSRERRTTSHFVFVKNRLTREMKREREREGWGGEGWGGEGYPTRIHVPHRHISHIFPPPSLHLLHSTVIFFVPIVWACLFICLCLCLFATEHRNANNQRYLSPFASRLKKKTFPAPLNAYKCNAPVCFFSTHRPGIQTTNHLPSPPPAFPHFIPYLNFLFLPSFFLLRCRLLGSYSKAKVSLCSFFFSESLACFGCGGALI